MTIRIVKHTVTINQDAFSLCNTIIFQEVNTVSWEENVVNKGYIPQSLDNTLKDSKNTYGTGETCNHVATVEAAVRNGLTTPACTSNAN